MTSTKRIKPKISVVMPIYNGEKYLVEAIDSILNQTYSDFELLLVNDGSKDATESIILSYTDERIIYVKNEENLGLIKTLNKGFDLAKGEFIARMDQDDIADPTRFEKQVSIFDHNEEIGVCGTGFTLFKDGIEDQKIQNPELPENIKISLLGRCPIGHPTIMLRKKIIGNNKYDNDYQAAEDYEFWTRLSRITKFYNIQESLLKYRFHETNISVLEKSTQHQNSDKIISNQLKYIGAGSNDTNVQLCKTLFAGFTRQFDRSALKQLIFFANDLEAKNRSKNFYDQGILNKIIDERLFYFFEKTKKDNIFLILFLLIYRKKLLQKKGIRNVIKLSVNIILRKQTHTK